MKTFPEFSAVPPADAVHRSLQISDLDPGDLFYHLRADAPDLLWAAMDTKGYLLVINLTKQFSATNTAYPEEAAVKLKGKARIEVDPLSARMIDGNDQAVAGAIQTHSGGTGLVINWFPDAGDLAKPQIEIESSKMLIRRGRAIQFHRWSLHLDDDDRSVVLMQIDVTPK